MSEQLERARQKYSEAMSTANGRWSEWGGRAESTADVLDELGAILNEAQAPSQPTGCTHTDVRNGLCMDCGKRPQAAQPVASPTPEEIAEKHFPATYAADDKWKSVDLNYTEREQCAAAIREALAAQSEAREKAEGRPPHPPEHRERKGATMTIRLVPRIPNIIQSPLFTICIDCGREQTLAKGELWPAYCECGGTLAAGHEPLVCMCATGQHCSVHSSREDWNPMEGGNSY